MGRKLPTINAGLLTVSLGSQASSIATHMFQASRLTVNEKQHRISGSLEFGSGFFKEQLVRIAF
jgi:16S rRNA C1402 N4-methylase RsmH